MKNKNQFEQYIGRTVGKRYVIEDFIGSGGMAAVFRAHDNQTGRTVALKMLRGDIADDSEELKHLVNESRAVARLSHPNIVGIYDVSVSGPLKYLVMEYVEGISLRAYMDRRGALPWNEVVRYSEQILAALEHAHSKGVIHRDIKPQNIMLLKNGIVKVTDFGIAQVSDSETVSFSGSAVGTVYYISPEQAESGDSDARSDLYSLGIMMYEMATGRIPFYSEKAAAVLMMHLKEKPVPPRVYNKKIPRGLEQIILCAMEKEPRKRYASALDMFRELRRVEKNRHASVLTPAQIKKKKRSEKNRAEYRPSSSLTPVVLGIATAVLLVAIVSVFVVLDRLNITTLGSESITVPDVVGRYYLSRDDAGSASAYNNQLKELGLTKGNYNLDVVYVWSDADHPAGTIISQDPGAGAHRKTPCRITLEVSLGVERVAVADVTLEDYRTARSKLRKERFEIQLVFEENPVVPNGAVISTKPAAGELADRGSTVVLTVSRGNGSVKTAMPDCVGHGEADARFMLEAKQLYIGKVTYTRSTLAVGTVLWQSVEADTTVFSGVSVIDFIVSGGADYALNYYPDVRGLAISEAEDLLTKLGFTVKTVPVLSYSEKDKVISQDPYPGTQSEGATNATLQYSAGTEFSHTVKMNIDPTGMTVDNAKVFIDYDIGKQCEASHLAINIRYVVIEVRSEVEIGRIISASPVYGREVDVSGGTLYVYLRVSGGKYFVPDVRGYEEEDAVTTLEDENYAVRVEYVRDEDPDTEGYVVGYTGPYIGAAGDKDLVIVLISRGPDYEPPEETTAASTVVKPEDPQGPEVQ